MPNYGLGGHAPSVEATGGNLDGANATEYTWDTPRRKVQIQNHADSAIDLYVLWNDHPASVTVWDVHLEPDKRIDSPDGIVITKVSIFGDSAGTKGADFSVRGWD